MSESQSRLGQAQAAIRNSRLQHPDDQLLECFLTDSVDPEATVQYMFQRCTDGQKYYDLVPLLSEWKELVRSANQELKPLQELFCLFTGSTIQEQIQCNEDGVYGVQNHWLSLGVRTYGPSSSLKDQQLPFGMYLKTTHSDDYQALANEFGALKLVRDQTRVPVPGPLDADASYLLTTTIPGQRMGSYIDILSDDDLDIFKRDMQKYMAQLRSISRQELQKHAISNAVGGPCYDYRIVAYSDYDKERGDFLGPFIDKAEFNDTLRTPALPDVFHSTGHDIVFTHSDINMRNILMHNGRISGIVDWENSGWFPDYWEYTKAHYVTKLNKR
ncbi:hypothetical protein CEK26_013461 [Fusarium fujikuroi]|nr:hypothetical protein CEK27_013476 [Fusarium fujikuroi]QGJ00393.1 hypothetical protein CEK26_013461 [Fusarium fujikuroi]SCV52101.1 uncharacterized protein FFFS_10151 [Fusarium fujikuroi]